MTEYLFAETLALQKAAIAAIEAARGDTSSPPNWDDLKVALSKEVKRRGAPQSAISSVVELGYSYTEYEEFDNDIEQAKSVLKFIADLTEGKIFVETCRARAVRRLAQYYEAEGDLEEAKNLTQDLQVEAYTAMGMAEKIKFILDQMRLVLLSKDFVRVLIVSRKLRHTVFEAVGFEESKNQFFRYLAEYHLHEADYLEAARCYVNLLCFCSEQNAKNHRQDILKKEASKEASKAKSEDIKDKGSKEDIEEEEESPLFILDQEDANEIAAFCSFLSILAPHSEEKEKFISDLSKNPEIRGFTLCESVLVSYKSQELVKWPLPEFEKISKFNVFTKKLYPLEKDRMKLLRRSFLIKNFCLLAEYFSNIRFSDIKTMCCVTDDDDVDIEEMMADSICKGVVQGKIDRPQGIVIFGKQGDNVSMLNEGRCSLNKAYTYIQDTLLLIERERLIHSYAAPTH